MKSADLGTEKGQQLIEIWSKSVDTQMHFNEMQVKSRQLGLTFVTAALGVAIVLLSEGNDFSFTLYGCVIHVSVLLTAGAILALQAVEMLDLNVYHRMLRGAVSFGEDFERNCLMPMVGLNKGMTSSISHFSRHSDAKIALEDGKNVYDGKDSVTAYDKIRKFYRRTKLFLVFTAGLLIIFTNFSSLSDDADTKKVNTSATQQAAGQTAKTTGKSVAPANAKDPSPNATPNVSPTPHQQPDANKHP